MGERALERRPVARERVEVRRLKCGERARPSGALVGEGVVAQRVDDDQQHVEPVCVVWLDYATARAGDATAEREPRASGDGQRCDDVHCSACLR